MQHTISNKPTFTAEIESLNHEGRGVTHLNGKATFVFGALPGETVEFVIIKKHSKFNEANAVRVLKAAPERINAKCAHFGICGGCRLQHIPPETQIEHKQAVFLELLSHLAELTPQTLLPPLSADAWGYRRKARLSVKNVPKKEKVLVGFREFNGRFVADLQRCEVLHPSVGPKIDALSQLFWSMNARDKIAQVEIAVGDNDTAIIVRNLATLDEHDLNLLIEFCETQQWRLYLQPKATDSIYLVHPQDTDPQLSFKLDEFNLTLYFYPHQFIQVNAPMNQQMIQQALQLLDIQRDDRVLDLFCGIGNFSLPMATRCKHVVGTEGDADAIIQARHNAAINHIDNCDFYTANLFESQAHTHWAKQQYDKLLIDPPRSGAQEILTLLPKWQPQRIVYVSCHPATLARDAKIIHTFGYQLESAGVMDMFPHTQHVEAMALFVR